jgi:glycosyltransferase involved in cell wall biosynthesis
MRIVQVLTQPSGGPADHVADVSIALAARGHDVHVVMPDGAAAARVDAAGVERTADTMGGKGDLGGARAVFGLLRSLKPDVVHLQDRRAGLGRLAARRLGVPAVYTLHGAPDGLSDLVPGNLRAAPRRRRDRLYYLTAERRLASYGRLVVASHALASYATGAIGVPRDRVDVVPNGVDPSLYGPHEGGSGVLWAGLMVPVKRLDVLLDALVDVDMPATLLGDGPEAATVKRGIVSRGLRHVAAPGFVADVRPYLARADVLALTSAAENCPLVVLQAMAAGVPVVASSVGGVPELVEDGVTGLLVPPGDAPALAAALTRVRPGMGEAGRARVERLFTIERCVDGLLASYEKAA